RGDPGIDPVLPAVRGPRGLTGSLTRPASRAGGTLPGARTGRRERHGGGDRGRDRRVGTGGERLTVGRGGGEAAALPAAGHPRVPDPARHHGHDRRGVERDGGGQPADPGRRRGRAAGRGAGTRGRDVVVPGRRGRGPRRGLAGGLLGSVSTQVVHHAACPVVVVRS